MSKPTTTSKAQLTEYLSVPQVAEQLQVCPATVYSLIKRKVLPAVWIGRHLRVRPEVLEAWVAAGGGR
jgi:excisionase family DNA binding protein